MRYNILLLVLVALLSGFLFSRLADQDEPLLNQITQAEIDHEINRMLAMPAPQPKQRRPIRQSITLDRVSVYNAVPRQTAGDPTVSSCGANLPRQIAVSRDLFFDSEGRKHLCGTVVSVITDRGEVFEDYVIWDTMAPRFTNTADILWHNNDEGEAYAFGITTGQLHIH